MAQGNVISAPWRYPLHHLIFPCSISLSRIKAPAVAEPRIRHAMKSAEEVRTESDARRSALMAAAQKGDRAAYEKLLRDCASLIASLPRRRGVPPACVPSSSLSGVFAAQSGRDARGTKRRANGDARPIAALPGRR